MNANVTSSLIAASAGTGKTYKLAARFISLLALGMPPTVMIALTFTRKAAQEFQERIIRELAAGAADDAGAEKLAQMVRETWKSLCPVATEQEHPLNRLRFGVLLREVVNAMSRLHLSTLDSFFQMLVSMGRSDLGLSSIALVTDNALTQARQKALSALLFDINNDSEHQADYIDTLQSLAEGGEMDLTGTLQRIIAEYGDLFKKCPDSHLWGSAAAFGLKYPAGYEPLTLEKARAWEARLRDLLAPLAVDAELMQKLLDAPVQLHYGMHDYLADVKKFCKKYKPAGELAEQLEALQIQARGDALRIVSTRTASMAFFLKRYFAHYKAEVQDRGMLEYADFTRLVPLLLQKDGVPSLLAYRMDASMRHWMLDEFQDTSLSQWSALTPLVESIAEETSLHEDKASDRSLFVVGDVKQSIYGWRGGAPELFDELQSVSPWQDCLQKTEMNLSWRSSQVIMDFVNRVFANCSRVQQHAAAKSRPGYVRVECTENGNQESIEEDTCQRIAAILKSLPIRDKQMSVGILVREHKFMQLIHKRLLALCPDLPIYLEGKGESPAASPMGEVLLAFFRWLEHPGDVYRKSILQNSPLWRCLPAGKHGWAYWQESLRTRGYAYVLQQISAVLLQEEDLLSPYHREQLSVWQREALAHDAAGGDLPQWIAHMEQLSENCASPRHAVHIQTLHGSKGLEYDAVILPFVAAPTAAPFDHGRHFKIFTAGEGHHLNGLMLRDKRFNDAWKSEMSAFEAAWREKQIAEGENLLYVAITRAVHANYIILNAKQKPNSNTFAGIIKNALGGEEAEFGNPDWVEAVGFPDRTNPAVAEEKQPLALMPRRKRVSPSHLDSEHADAGVHTAGDGIEFGNEVHALFEQVEWVDALPEWVQQPQSAAQRVVAEALQQSEVRALFTRKPGQVVYNEQRLEAVEGDKWISAAIDRLVVEPEGALIIDFKTNKVGETDRGWLREHYAPQMRSYRRLVAAALQLDESAVRVSLISVPREGAAVVLPYVEGEP